MVTFILPGLSCQDGADDGLEMNRGSGYSLEGTSTFNNGRGPEMKRAIFVSLVASFILLFPSFAPLQAWFDETHVTIAKAAGCSEWVNAVALT